MLTRATVCGTGKHPNINVKTQIPLELNGNKIKQVYQKNSIIMGGYHISQLGGRYNLKVRADFCVEVRLDSGTS